MYFSGRVTGLPNSTLASNSAISFSNKRKIDRPRDDVNAVRAHVGFELDLADDQRVLGEDRAAFILIRLLRAWRNRPRGRGRHSARLRSL